MLNSRDRSEALLHAHLEAEAAKRRDEMLRISETALGQRERFEAEKRKAMQDIHAESVAAEARMRDPSLISWQGAATALFLLALAAGMFLVATYLGN